MEIGKKCKKKCDVSYSQMPTVTESSELNQTTGCEPIFNLSLKPNKIESLKLEGAEFEESTLPIFTGINSHLVTQRRSRKKNISKDSTFKSQTVSSTNKTYHDLGKVKHVVRITDLIRLFFEKAVRNNPYRQPVCYDPS